MSSNCPTNKSPPHHRTGDISSIQEQVSIEGDSVFEEGNGVFEEGGGVFEEGGSAFEEGGG
eukprot:2578902-Ditylum_brightwellii.AAC.1